MDEKWNEFYKSGKITDYLSYLKEKRGFKTEAAQQKKDGKACKGNSNKRGGV